MKDKINWQGTEQRDWINHNFWEKFVTPNVFRIKGNKCEWCGSTKNLHIHHTRYDLVTINTLKLLCKSCHKKEHYRLKKIDVNSFPILWNCFITNPDRYKRQLEVTDNKVNMKEETHNE